MKRRNIRGTLAYKISMWWCYFTWDDFKCICGKVQNIFLEAMVALLVLLAVFFLPAFLH